MLHFLCQQCDFVVWFIHQTDEGKLGMCDGPGIVSFLTYLHSFNVVHTFAFYLYSCTEYLGILQLPYFWQKLSFVFGTYLSYRIFFKFSNTCHYLNFCVCFPAVSYTHLDVYKRQPTMNIVNTDTSLIEMLCHSSLMFFHCQFTNFFKQHYCLWWQFVKQNSKSDICTLFSCRHF